MRFGYFIVLVVVLALMLSCAAPTPTPMPPPVEPAPTPTPKPTEVTKSGIITHDETRSGEVYIPKGVEVTEGVTLTIEPETVVRFKHWRYGCTDPDNRGALIVRGTLTSHRYS